MLLEELDEGFTSDPPQCLQCRPAEQEVADQVSADVREPVQNLRKIALQARGHPVAEASAVRNQTAAMLDQIAKRARLFIIRPPRPQVFTVVEE